MKILDAIVAMWTGRQASVRPTVSNVSYSDAVMEAFGVQAGGIGVSAASAMRVSAVAACVGKIAGAVISMPLNVYETNGDTKAKLPKDNLWFLLNEQPSAMYTASSMWEGVVTAQLLRGDAFVLIKRDIRGAVRELLPLPWGCVSPVRAPGEGVRYYVNMPTHGISTWFDPSDILHFPGLCFDDTTMRSQSVIAAGARSAVGGALAMDQYSQDFFTNGAHPSIILSSDKVMNPEQVSALQTAFRTKYAGADNFHKVPLVLTEGLSAKEISISAHDSQLIEARRFSVLDICRAFGVPPHLVGETTGSTSWGSGIESMGRSFVSYTLQPWLTKIENEINRKIFPRNVTRFLRFDRDALIEGDSAAQAAYNRAALGGPGSGQGWMCVDEIRKMKGLAPLGGAAAEIFDPRSMQAPAKPKPESTPTDE